MKVGFVGLGRMGFAMAVNLLRAGHEVHAWNRSSGAAMALTELGGKLANSTLDAFDSDVVISMLADDRAVQAVFLDEGVVENAPSGSIHVNMSTISVHLARNLAEFHRDHGIKYISAPVFGRTEVATAGQLHILAAGDSSAIEKVSPLFSVIGCRTWQLGPTPHVANALKISGNFITAATIEAFGEAVALAKAYGIEPERTIQVLTNTVFTAPVHRTYGGLIANRTYEPAAFRLALGLKDVRLALLASEDKCVPMPFASVLRDQHIAAIAYGDGDKDWAALAEVSLRAGLRRIGALGTMGGDLETGSRFSEKNK